MNKNQKFFSDIVGGKQDLFWILHCEGIPRFTMLMWGHKNKTAEAKTA